jgi:pimeloyl-ACP methyl ester carboxylesterase
MWRAAIVAMGLSAFASSACCKVRITPDSFLLHRAEPLPVMSDWFGAEFDADVLAFDARGFGFSDGPADIDAMIDDSLRIYDYAIKQGKFEETKQGRSEEPPIVIGQSMGSSSAIHIGANRPTTGLLLLAPLSSYRDVIEAIDRAAPWYVHVEADETLVGLRSSPLLDLAQIRGRGMSVRPRGPPRTCRAAPSQVRRLHGRKRSGAQQSGSRARIWGAPRPASRHTRAAIGTGRCPSPGWGTSRPASSSPARSLSPQRGPTTAASFSRPGGSPKRSTLTTPPSA